MSADPSPTERGSEQTAWTAGPWKIMPNRPGEGSPWSICSENALCSADGFATVWIDKDQHNARLIAAAPELYEALADLLSTAENQFSELDEHSHLGQWPETPMSFLRARAALAKARALDASGGDDGAR